MKDPGGGFEILPEMAAAALIIDASGMCEGQAGDVGEMLDLPDGWTAAGHEMDRLVAYLATRGDYGPRFSDGAALKPGFFVDPRFQEAYLETPSGRIVNAFVQRRMPEGWIVTLTDTTLMKYEIRSLWQAKTQLAEIAEQARSDALAANQASQAKTAFLAAMSHEIRTPMSGLIGMADLLADTPLDHDQRSQLSTLQNSSEAMLEIINDILDFSKIEAGRMELHREPVDVLRVAEEVVELLATRLKGPEVELTLVCSPELPTSVLGDAMRIRQILLNVIGNAVKFTEAGKIVVQIDGTVRAGRSELSIIVSDTGPGIPPEDLERIFVQYQQSSLTRSVEAQGTGLGLAIVRRLLGLMGGTISAASPPNAGAVFTIDLTLDQWQRAPKQPETRLSGLRIACAEPRAAHRRMLEAWLSRAGAEVSTAPDLARLDQVFADEAPDIIIANLPDGMAYEELVACLPPDIGSKIVLSTRHGQELRGEAARMPRLRRPFLPRRIANQLIAAIALERSEPTAPESPNRLIADPPVRVMIAEDNPINRKVFEKLLAREPIYLHFAPDGQAAVDAMNEFRPEFVFMDLSMPVLDGLSATEIIRAGQAGDDWVGIPILALTANVQDEDRRRCAAVGITETLLKPIRRDDLLRAISDYIPRAVFQATSTDDAGIGAGSTRSVA